MKNTPVKTTSTTPDGDWVFAARIALAGQNLPHASVLRASSPTFETTASQNLPALELEFDSRFGGRSSLEFNLCADRCDADAGGRGIGAPCISNGDECWILCEDL
jgi:hypothetical protein